MHHSQAVVNACARGIQLSVLVDATAAFLRAHSLAALTVLVLHASCEEAESVSCLLYTFMIV